MKMMTLMTKFINIDVMICNDLDIGVSYCNFYPHSMSNLMCCCLLNVFNVGFFIYSDL